VLADLSSDEFVNALLPTMFTPAAAADAVTAFRVSMLEVHPVGFRAMARASAENLRHALPKVDVPTLLVYGEKDVRAGLPVARDLEAAIAGSTLVVLPETGHVCNIEAPAEFNDAVRTFLRSHT
jgi:pimeloyl-ACP methyl ester carboxylesterase